MSPAVRTPSLIAMRHFAFAILAAMLVGCDTSQPDSGVCFVGAETEVEGSVSFQITAPVQGDTLRVGESFRFRAEVEAVGEVSEVVLRLVDERWADPEGVLFERSLGAQVGTYVVDQMIVLDSIRTGADLSEVYVFGTGSALINTACGGVYGGGGGNLVPVTVLD